jgi:methylated-DNA-[protein]-cysteine S-methyltransferase
MQFLPPPVRTTVTSPLGQLTLAAHDQALVGVWFDFQEHLPAMAHWRVDDQHPVLRQAAQELQEYFAGQRRTFGVPLDLGYGTDFQQRVWRSLLAIAAGTTSTYGAISLAIGNPSAVRAVGGAIGRNPIGIIVPCHRIIGANGALTGYAGGLERKVALLRLEGALL